jgi:hypothetical protein
MNENLVCNWCLHMYWFWKCRWPAQNIHVSGSKKYKYQQDEKKTTMIVYIWLPEQNVIFLGVEKCFDWAFLQRNIDSAKAFYFTGVYWAELEQVYATHSLVGLFTYALKPRRFQVIFFSYLPHLWPEAESFKQPSMAPFPSDAGG